MAAPESRWKRVATIAAVLSVAVVGVGGVLHLPFARGLLRRAGGCPIGIEASPQQFDKAHQAALASQRGSTMAPARPALGFTLEQTTRAEVQAWADRGKVSCTTGRQKILSCESIAPSLLGVSEVEGPVTTMSFAFDARDRLVDISAIRMQMSPAAALAASNQIAGDLAKQLGATHTQSAPFDANQMSKKGIASLASITYRFRDFAVDVVFMQFEHDGLVLREHYASIADGS